MWQAAEYLLGRIAVREGFLTQADLLECLIAQDYNPTKSIGTIMVEKGYITAQQLEELLAIQKKRMLESSTGEDRRSCMLFGKLVIEHGFATEAQVNECLKLQGEFIEIGVRPVPPLGEIMIKKGYIKPEVVETVLQLQNLSLYICPICGNPPQFETKDDRYICSICKNPVPENLARLYMRFAGSIKAISDKMDIELTDEVKRAAEVPANHFSRYILINEVGRGGASNVFKAWHKMWNKYVALKILRHQTETGSGVKTVYGDAEDIRRFYAEARAIAELDHPNIVALWDYGIYENSVFIAMRFIEGKSLDDILLQDLDKKPENRTLTIESSLKIIRDIALALDYAHNKGVYHRDIKPQNIIIDKTGKPWLTDFGVAKLIKIGDPAYKKGVIMGTPCYMPPEQANGDMEEVDNLSDIYSLGAVLYELVTNRPPFADGTATQTLDKVIYGDLTPPSQIRRDLPRDVEFIILKCMKKRKKERFQSAKELADAIDAFLSGKQIKIEPPPKRGLLARIFSLFRRLP